MSPGRGRGKRSLTGSGSTSSATKKRKSGSSFLDTASEVVVNTLRESGLVLRSEGPHVLKKELPAFVRAMSDRFRLDVHHPREADMFRRDLIDLLKSSDSALSSFLMPMAVEMPEGPEGGRMVKESLVRGLMQLEEVQAELFSWLMEKAVMAAVEEEGEQGRASQPGEGLPLSRLIVTQVRWLNRVFEGERMADKVVEVLRCCPAKQFLSDLLSALPDLVAEVEQSRVATVVEELMRGDADLTGAALDALACLSVGEDTLEDIRYGCGLAIVVLVTDHARSLPVHLVHRRNSVTKRLSSTALEDLPSVLRFLLDTASSAGDEEEAVREMRNHIDLSQSKLMTQISQTAKKGTRKENGRDVDVILVHLLEDSVSCNRRMANAWFKALDELNTSRSHTPVDFLVLLTLHKIPAKKKPIENMIRRKIRHGTLTEDLLRTTFSSHHVVLKTFLEDIIALMAMLGQSTDSALVHFSLLLRREAFLHLDKVCKQEVFADLVGKVGCGGPGRASALKALVYLTKHYTEETARFASFIESILDFVGLLELSEVKEVMDVLSLLAYSTADQGSALQSNLHMVIKKQIVSKNSKLVKMGLAGAVVTIKNMTSQRSADETLSSLPSFTQEAGPSSPPVGPSNVTNAMNLLRRVLAKSKAAGEYAGLLMDELADVVESSGLDPRLESYIVSTLTADFQRDYILDVSEDGSLKGVEEECLLVPAHPAYNAEGEDPDIALSVAPIVADRDRKEAKNKAETMLSEFRLLKASTCKKASGNLDDILALLSCPVAMPKEENLLKFEVVSTTEKDVVCACLFYCVNWFREVLNAFARTEEEELRQKVLVRLKDILRIRSELQVCLALHPGFVPPSVNHMVDVSTWQPPAARAGKKEKTGKGLKRKGAPGGDASQTHVDRGAGAGSPGNVDLDLYAPFLRELDFHAFSILSYDVVTISSEPPEVEERKDPKLRPPELAYLLKDLEEKLERSLVAAKSDRKRTFPGTMSEGSAKVVVASFLDRLQPLEVASRAVHLLDHLLGDLDEVAHYHRRLIEVNDGVLDSPGMFNSQTASVLECQERIFHCLCALFAWSGFCTGGDSSSSFSNDRGGGARPLLRKALAAVARRSDASATATKATQVLAGAAFDHLMRARETTLHAGGAVAHLSLLATLLGHTEEEEDDGEGKRSKELVQTAKMYLARDWRNACGDKEKGAKYGIGAGGFFFLPIRMLLNKLDLFLQVQCASGKHPEGFTRQERKVCDGGDGVVHQGDADTAAVQVSRCRQREISHFYSPDHGAALQSVPGVSHQNGEYEKHFLQISLN